jgi:hypothetical protein
MGIEEVGHIVDVGAYSNITGLCGFMRLDLRLSQSWESSSRHDAAGIVNRIGSRNPRNRQTKESTRGFKEVEEMGKVDAKEKSAVNRESEADKGGTESRYGGLDVMNFVRGLKSKINGLSRRL